MTVEELLDNDPEIVCHDCLASIEISSFTLSTNFFVQAKGTSSFIPITFLLISVPKIKEGASIEKFTHDVS